jgi:hypothetical protein
VRLSSEAHVQPFLILFEKLRLLLDQPGIPHGAADSVLQLVEHLNKCFRVKLVYESAARTEKASDRSELMTKRQVFSHRDQCF